MAVAVKTVRTDTGASRVVGVSRCACSAVCGHRVVGGTRLAGGARPSIAADAGTSCFIGAGNRRCVVCAILFNGAGEITIRVVTFVSFGAGTAVLIDVERWRTEVARRTLPLVAARAVAARHNAGDSGGATAAVQCVSADARASRIGAGVANGARGTVRSRRVLGRAGTAGRTCPRAAALAVAARVGVAADSRGLPGAVGR